MIKKVSLVVLLCILFFCLVEASLRITARLSKKTLFSALTIDDSVLDWRLIPNYKDEKAGIYINSLGFRGKEFKKAKGNGIFRIIALGDSCTFGVGTLGTPYPEILEKELNAINLKYEVLNAGVPGYTSSQAALYFQRGLINYKPDLTLVYIGWNNVWTYKNPGANTAYSSVCRKISRTLSKSLAFTLLRNSLINPLRRITKPAFKPAGNNSYEEKLKEKSLIYKQGLIAIIQAANANNCNIMLFTLPTPIRKGMRQKDMEKFPLAQTWTDGYETFLQMQAHFNGIIRNLAGKEKIELIDLCLIFNELPSEKVKTLFKDAVHPNEKGLLLIAQYISQKISSRN